jgi:hypothetical protein
MPCPPPTTVATACWALLLAGSLAACIEPSDVSGDVLVTVEATTNVIIQGQGIALRAHAWHRTSGGQLEEVRGVSYHWQAKTAGIVSIADSGSKAILTGVSRGRDSVFAIPIDYEDAIPGALEVRVAASVEIDQVTPATVRYGEEITVSGVGLGRATRFGLGEADLIPEQGSFSGDSTGLGELRLWIPFPARSDRLVAVTGGTSTTASDTTKVEPFDPYEPNDSLPSIIQLNPASSGNPSALFFNPALALESGGAVDRYQLLTSDTARALTIMVSDASPLAASFEADVSSSSGDWTIGIRNQVCRDSLISIDSIVPDTVVRAFTSLPAGGLQLVVRGPPSRYDLRVLDGYRRQNPAVGPDRFEENDYCTAADDPTKRIDLSAPFSDTLTIDNGYELDWFRIAVPGTGTQLVTIRTAARPFGAVDSSNIGLALFTAPEPQPVPIGMADEPGSAEELSLELEPGEYYLLVADRGGVATRYSLCIALGSSCSLVAAVQHAKSPRTRLHLESHRSTLHAR